MQASRRAFIQSLGLTGAAATLPGCDATRDALIQLIEPDAQQDFRPTASTEVDLTTHALNRLTYGGRPGDYQRVKKMGVDAFIDEQLHPRQIPDRRCDFEVMSIESLAEPTAELYEYDHRRLFMDLVQYKLLRAVYSNRQLFEVMVDFWTDHFNIVSEKGDCRWLKAADDRDVIRKHALGRFADLLRASALSPAMLIYLDGHDNKVVEPTDRPNENYARELLELHTLGVHAGYTQQDIMEVARCLSGWTYQNKPLSFQGAQVRFVPKRHDGGPKTVLGQHIPSGGGADDLQRVIDIVSNHPATASYLATKLCRRFIADPAPPSAVRSVADAFTASRGDIPATLDALFKTSDFRDNLANRANLFKRPQRFIVSALRATNAETDWGRPIANYLARMGHASFQYPTPDGYPIERQPWLGTLLWRWKLALALQRQQLKGTRIDHARLLDQLGGVDPTAAHLLGRTPTPLERQLVRQSTEPLAVLVASPAFQVH